VYTRESREVRTRQTGDPRLRERSWVSDRQEPGGIRDGKAGKQNQCSMTLGSATEAAVKAEMAAWKHTRAHALCPAKPSPVKGHRQVSPAATGIILRTASRRDAVLPHVLHSLPAQTPA